MITVTKVTEDWNDDLGMTEWHVEFTVTLDGDTYEGKHFYCPGNEYESVNHVSVTLDGIDQYSPGHYDEDLKEFIPFTGTHLARTIPEDYWCDEFIYTVLAPIETARERATRDAIAAIENTMQLDNPTYN
jgi:hypothetical protein